MSTPSLPSASARSVVRGLYLLLGLTVVGGVIVYLAVVERNRGGKRFVAQQDELREALYQLDRVVLFTHIGTRREPSATNLGAPVDLIAELAISHGLAIQAQQNVVLGLARVGVFPDAPPIVTRLNSQIDAFVVRPDSILALEGVLLSSEQLRRLAVPGGDLRPDASAHQLPEERPWVTGLLFVLFAGIVSAGALLIRSSQRSVRALVEAIAERDIQVVAFRTERDFTASLTDTAPAIILSLDPEGVIQHVNPFFERLTGWRLDEVRGRDWFTTCLPERDRDRIRSLYQVVTRDVRISDYINPILTRSGQEREIEWNNQSLRDGAGRFTGLLAVGIDVTERQRVIEALRASEARLNEAQRIAQVGSWDLNLVTGYLHWSDEIFRLFEIDQAHFGASYEAFLNVIHPEDRDAVNAAYTSSLRDRKPYRIVHRLRMADGRIKHVEEQCETDFSAAGTPLESRGTVQDMTERVVAEEAVGRSLREKEILLREIHHRVKNNLQIISSLLYFETQKVRDAQAIAVFGEVRERLRSMMLVHEKLYNSRDLAEVDFADYVRSLANQLASSSAGLSPSIHFNVEVVPLALPIDQALPCGMILVELLTNVIKYAFPGGNGGEAHVQLTLANGRVALTVGDEGVGLPPDFDAETTGSFGWQLIRNLTTQLGGTTMIERAAGTRVTVSFPRRVAPAHP